MTRFADRLKELRIDKGLTQLQVANAMNVHHSTVKDWEKRGKQPNYETLIALAKFFGVTIDYLLGATD